MNTLRFGATNSLTVNLVGQSIRNVLANTGYRGALGYGGDVQAKVNGGLASADYLVREGDVIDIENRAQQKAAGARVTINYGATASITREVPTHQTVRGLLTDRNIRAALGFTDGAIAKVNGATVSNDLYVTDGMRIDIETQAQQKAAL